eukprot:506618-Pleurochrysis_carterae.AAC.2
MDPRASTASSRHLPARSGIHQYRAAIATTAFLRSRFGVRRASGRRSPARWPRASSAGARSRRAG